MHSNSCKEIAIITNLRSLRKMKTLIKAMTVLFLMSSFGSAWAGTFNCGTDTNINYMIIDDTKASSCIDSGEGNISGNSSNDPFLTAHTNYKIVSKSDSCSPLG